MPAAYSSETPGSRGETQIELSTVTVTRRRFYFGSLRSMDIFVDGQLATSVRIGGTVSIPVPPGCTK